MNLLFTIIVTFFAGTGDGPEILREGKGELQ